MTGVPRSKYAVFPLAEAGLDNVRATEGAQDGSPTVLTMDAVEAPLTSNGVHEELAVPTSAVKLRNRCDGDKQPALPGTGLPKTGAGVGPYSFVHGGNRVEPYPNRSRGKV